MGKKQVKCLLCGGTIGYDANAENYKCIDCNAHHSSDLFGSYKKIGTRFRLTKLRIFFAILGALYLLYWLYRVMIY
jgi:hypothetical protein